MTTAASGTTRASALARIEHVVRGLGNGVHVMKHAADQAGAQKYIEGVATDTRGCLPGLW